MRGIKFYRHGDYRSVEKAEVPVEAAREGNVFSGEIRFRDLVEKQLELLCYSLGLDGSFKLKVGGNKAGFFGSCETIIKESVLTGRNNENESFDACAYAKRYGMGDESIRRNKEKFSDILFFSDKGGD